MQYNQSFFTPRVSNYGQCQQYTPFSPQLPYSLPSPEIAGEGDVLTIIYPDGNLQFFFMPTSRPSLNNGFGANNIPMPLPFFPPNSTNEAWFIKSVSNPIPASLFFQNYESYFGVPCPYMRSKYMPGSISDYNSSYSTGHQLKFHNDGWTSTTDLHYFFPSLRQCEWIPKVDAAGQINTQQVRREIQYEVVYQPCSCDCEPKISKAQNERNIESMSVDDNYESKPKTSRKIFRETKSNFAQTSNEKGLQKKLSREYLSFGESSKTKHKNEPKRKINVKCLCSEEPKVSKSTTKTNDKRKINVNCLCSEDPKVSKSTTKANDIQTDTIPTINSSTQEESEAAHYFESYQDTLNINMPKTYVSKDRQTCCVGKTSPPPSICTYSAKTCRPSATEANQIYFDEESMRQLSSECMCLDNLYKEKRKSEDCRENKTRRTNACCTETNNTQTSPRCKYGDGPLKTKWPGKTKTKIVKCTCPDGSKKKSKFLKVFKKKIDVDCYCADEVRRRNELINANKCKSVTIQAVSPCCSEAIQFKPSVASMNVEARKCNTNKNVRTDCKTSSRIVQASRDCCNESSQIKPSVSSMAVGAQCKTKFMNTDVYKTGSVTAQTSMECCNECFQTKPSVSSMCTSNTSNLAIPKSLITKSRYHTNCTKDCSAKPSPLSLFASKKNLFMLTEINDNAHTVKSEQAASDSEDEVCRCESEPKIKRSGKIRIPSDECECKDSECEYVNTEKKINETVSEKPKVGCFKAISFNNFKADNRSAEKDCSGSKSSNFVDDVDQDDIELWISQRKNNPHSTVQHHAPLQFQPRQRISMHTIMPLLQRSASTGTHRSNSTELLEEEII